MRKYITFTEHDEDLACYARSSPSPPLANGTEQPYTLYFVDITAFKCLEHVFLLSPASDNMNERSPTETASIVFPRGVFWFLFLEVLLAATTNISRPALCLKQVCLLLTAVVFGVEDFWCRMSSPVLVLLRVVSDKETIKQGERCISVIVPHSLCSDVRCRDEPGPSSHSPLSAITLV